MYTLFATKSVNSLHPNRESYILVEGADPAEEALVITDYNDDQNIKYMSREDARARATKFKRMWGGKWSADPSYPNGAKRSPRSGWMVAV
tara:strand:- start:8294 stop:8563 length:270 start_codon:yes stop_codon:yes gene_type:complete